MRCWTHKNLLGQQYFLVRMPKSCLLSPIENYLICSCIDGQMSLTSVCSCIYSCWPSPDEQSVGFVAIPQSFIKGFSGVRNLNPISVGRNCAVGFFTNEGLLGWGIDFRQGLAEGFRGARNSNLQLVSRKTSPLRRPFIELCRKAMFLTKVLSYWEKQLHYTDQMRSDSNSSPPKISGQTFSKINISHKSGFLVVKSTALCREVGIKFEFVDSGKDTRKFLGSRCFLQYRMIGW